MNKEEKDNYSTPPKDSKVEFDRDIEDLELKGAKYARELHFGQIEVIGNIFEDKHLLKLTEEDTRHG